MRFNYFLALFLFFTPVNQLSAQTCETVVVPPTGINGIQVSHVFGASTGLFLYPFTSCGIYYTPPNSVWMGWNGPSTYTVYFNQPINNVTFVMTATGQTENETFTFTTDVGLPVLTDVSSCYSSVNGNVLTTGLTADSLGGGGLFTVSNASDYTSIIIEGQGLASGSLIAICASIIPAPIPEPVPDPVSPCEKYSDLANLEIPNVITPDGDGINDKLLINPDYAECYGYEIDIYNRWGNKVYHGTDETILFRGIDQNGDQLSLGVYFYSFKSNNQEKNGYLSLF